MRNGPLPHLGVTLAHNHIIVDDIEHSPVLTLNLSHELAASPPAVAGKELHLACDIATALDVELERLKVAGKKVLVRVDFNVPLKDGVITNDNRIQAALPTIKKLIADGGKVVLCSHLGKPKNGPEDKFSLKPAADRLAELVDTKVVFAKDDTVVGENAKKAVAEMNNGEIVVLENTRFRGADETKNGENLSQELAALVDGEVFVMDAFGSAHRAHASVAVVTKYITEKGGENAVGYLMQKEIDFLGNAVENPVRPFVAILGGAKVADKLNVIDNLLNKCDTLIIGGGMAFTFLKAQGYEIGKSLCDDEKLDYCKEMMAKAEKLGKKLLLPVLRNATNTCNLCILYKVTL